MYQEIIDLLFHPGIFFERRNKEKISLVIPAIIIGIGGVVNFLSPLAERAIIDGGDLSHFVVMPLAVVFFLVLPFVLWFVVAGILTVFSWFFSGTGSFSAMLQNCGYGYLPQTLLSPLVIINGIALASWSPSTSSAIPTGVIIVVGIIPILSIFWSGWLWSVAMEKTHALSRGRAMAGAALVVLLYLSPLILNIIADIHANGYPAR
jgi:hypothetical protein